MKNTLLLASIVALGSLAACDTTKTDANHLPIRIISFEVTQKCETLVGELLKNHKLNPKLNPEDPLFPEKVKFASRLEDSIIRACENHHERTGQYPSIN